MERNLKLRIYVALVWVPLLLLISYVGGILLLVFVLAATYLGLLEFSRLLEEAMVHFSPERSSTSQLTRDSSAVLFSNLRQMVRSSPS